MEQQLSQTSEEVSSLRAQLLSVHPHRLMNHLAMYVSIQVCGVRPGGREREEGGGRGTANSVQRTTEEDRRDSEHSRGKCNRVVSVEL